MSEGAFSDVTVHMKKTNEPGNNNSCKIACAPSEDSDQTAQMRSLIRVFSGQLVGRHGTKADSVD